MQVSAASLAVLKFHFKPDEIIFVDDEQSLSSFLTPDPFGEKLIVSTKLVLKSFKPNPLILLHVPKDNVKKWTKNGVKQFKVPALTSLVDKKVVVEVKKAAELFPSPSTLLLVQEIARAQGRVVDDKFLKQFHDPSPVRLKGRLGTMGMHQQLLKEPEREFGRIVFGWLPTIKGFEWPVFLLHQQIETSSHVLSLKGLTILWHWGLLENHYLFDPCQI